ncbi:MAG: hypothetical protein IJQ16_10680 [Selenomonadaceae bacterium]|nr:hypothetical protein [Selenomonadaceae bacterium]
MSNRKLSITDLKSKLQSLQDKIDQEEQKLNGEIGAWVRQQTNVDYLKDLQDNFIIIPQKNKQQAEKVPDILPKSPPFNFPTGQKNPSAPPTDLQNVAQSPKPQKQPNDDILFEKA